jgi:hypothetical protein
MSEPSAEASERERHGADDGRAIDRALAQELLSKSAPERQSASDQLYGVMDLLAGVNESNAEEVPLLLMAWREDPDPGHKEPDTARILGVVIESGQRDGEFRPDTDPNAVGALLLDAYVGVLMRWLGDDRDRQPRFPLRDAVHEVCRIVVEGLRPGECRGRRTCGP